MEQNMIKEEIGMGRTVQAAIADGAEKVRVWTEVGHEQTALDYLNNVMQVMGFTAAKASLSRELNSEGGKVIRIDGADASALIGRHGETLDALQYLSNLALNAELDKKGENCPKITVDIEGYRTRREETLRSLAKRTADKVKRYKRNIALEPMTPYERRIIHSALQNDSLVMTASVVSDENRKVVIHYVGNNRKSKEAATEE